MNALGSTTSKTAVRVFISYAHRDEQFRTRLEVALATLKREGLVETWSDRQLMPGCEWDGKIHDSLQHSDVVLLLVSPDFVNSSYIHESELSCALDRHDRGEATIVPIFVRPVDIGRARFGALQGLPRDAKPVTQWRNRDEAWRNVSLGIRQLVEKILVGGPTNQSRASSFSNRLPTNVPSRPEAFLSRPNYLLALASILGEVRPHAPALRVVRGASGAGKSSVVADFVRQLGSSFADEDFQWVDCRVTYERPLHLRSRRLIVFDNVTTLHPFISANWLADLADSSIIITTQSAAVERWARSLRQCLDAPETLVVVDAFSRDEAESFIRRCVAEQFHEAAAKMGQFFSYSPPSLQLIRQLFVMQAEMPAVANAEHSDADAGLRELTTAWARAIDDSGSLNTLVEALAAVPFCGMDRLALAAVLELDLKELDAALNKLFCVGLATETYTVEGRTDRGVVILHEVLRSAYQDVDHPLLPLWRRRYVQLLEERLTAGVDDEGALTCVDAWLSGWCSVFDPASGDDQVTRHKRHEALLERIACRDSAVWSAAMRSLPQYVIDRMRDPGKENCAILIGVAHIVSRFRPHAALAQMVWAGARNPNLWARSASIAAAARQWQRLNLAERERGAKELRLWLTLASELAGTDGWDSNEDYDFLAVVAGLARLTNFNEARDVVDTAQFTNRFKTTTLSHLALVVLLTDQGVLSSIGSNRFDVFRKHVSQWIKTIELAPYSVQCTGYRVGKYVRFRTGLELQPLIGLGRTLNERDRTVALDIARLCDSRQLRDFVKREEDSPTVAYDASDWA
jgi:hypothetical protein